MGEDFFKFINFSWLLEAFYTLKRTQEPLGPMHTNLKKDPKIPLKNNRNQHEPKDPKRTLKGLKGPKIKYVTCLLTFSDDCGRKNVFK